jgi:nesprin-1
MQSFTEQLQLAENLLKDQSLKSTANEKQDHLDCLRGVLKDISSKNSTLKTLTDRARETGAESDICGLIADLNCNYNTLRKNCTDLVGKYEGYVKEHNTFNEQYSEFIQWIKMISEDLPQYSEINGDLKSLQDKKNGLCELEDLRNNEAVKFDSILELGEKLYAHTSQDGREVIRNQLKTLRGFWDKITEDILNRSASIDKCLQQFSDLTSLQEQLTKWLKDIETAMHHHTELRPSLQEKKGQLQSHKQIHQEITSHNSLVDAVCNKAKELVEQTQDKSLNAYIDSIRNLFLNIGLKSKDLSDKLQTCVNDHSKYSTEVNNFKDFAASQSELLSQCADVTGEKAELEHKAQILNELKQNKIEGDKKLVRLDEMCGVVCKSTAPKGAHRLRHILQEMNESWGTHTLLLDDIEINIEKALAQWKQFDADMTKLANWFKLYEEIFHSQVPQGSMYEKEEQLAMFLSKRNDIIAFENNIDDFVNNSHNLLQNTGTERLKTTIMQINNRYQLLHVLSKDVCARWQGIVEEHQNFDEKVAETKKWLRDLEDTMERAVKEINVELKSDMLQSIVAEQEVAPVKIHSMFAYAEQLYPDTSGPGREIIRQELKTLQQRWDNLLDKAENFQKKLDSQLQSWSMYQESLSEANNWLNVMDSAIKLDHINWLSLQESKSRLLKMKTTQQEVSSHKRFIESVNEKGAAVVQANPHAAAEEVQGAIEGINDKYDELQENIKKNVSMLENVIESIQQHQDLKKAFQDWQKDMWDKLSLCTDYSGNKIILEKRLNHLSNMISSVSEGEQHLKNISNHIEGMDGEQKMPSKAKEALEKDLQNLK